MDIYINTTHEMPHLRGREIVYNQIHDIQGAHVPELHAVKPKVLLRMLSRRCKGCENMTTFVGTRWKARRKTMGIALGLHPDA